MDTALRATQTRRHPAGAPDSSIDRQIPDWHTLTIRGECAARSVVDILSGPKDEESEDDDDDHDVPWIFHLVPRSPDCVSREKRGDHMVRRLLPTPSSTRPFHSVDPSDRGSRHKVRSLSRDRAVMVKVCAPFPENPPRTLHRGSMQLNCTPSHGHWGTFLTGDTHSPPQGLSSHSTGVTASCAQGPIFGSHVLSILTLYPDFSRPDLRPDLNQTSTRELCSGSGGFWSMCAC